MGSQIGALFKGLWGDAGKEFVDLQGGPDKVFGTKPEVAPYKQINLGDEIGKATSFNLENLDSITSLLDKVIPGFSDLLSTGTANAQALMEGNLPAGDLAALQRTSAYGALQGGFGGTGMSKSKFLSDYITKPGGLLEANLAGANSAQQWMNAAEQAYSPFVVTTGQTAGTTAANNAGKQAQQQFQFNIDAAPDPGALGIFNLDAALGQEMLSFGMAAGASALAGSGSGAASGALGGGSPYQAPMGNSLGGGYAGPFNATGNAPSWYTAPAWGYNVGGAG